MPPETTIEASSEAAGLAKSMTAEEYHATSIFAELAEDSQEIGAAITSIKNIQEKVETATSNNEELVALMDSCVSVTEQVLATYRRTKSGEIDVKLLLERLLRVQGVIERCGFRRRVESFVKGPEDKAEIFELQAFVENMVEEMDLAGIVAREGAADSKEEYRGTEGTAARDVSLVSQFGKMGFIEEEQDQESAERPTKSLLELANVPEGAPALPSWHIERGDVMQDLCNGLRHVGWPRVLGLVGDSGSGKTTAASEVVRTKEMRELFHDGILWLPVNKGGKDRLPTLMRQLASMMHEEVMRSTGRAPTESENTTSFIRKLMEGGYKGEGLRCLVVADDTWEPEVIAKLQETTIWVLVTTHDEKLVTNSGGKVVALGDFSEDDSRLVLREAAELRKEVALPDAATELVELCGRFAMDLVSVGRWGTIRGNEDLSAWSDAAVAIRAELEGAKMDVESDTAAGGTRAKQRMAVLRAGLHILGTVNEQARWLYVALAVMPHGHTFTAQDAAMLLNDGPFATVDGEAAEAAAEEALHTLEQWAIVATAEGGPGGKYRIHDAHSNVARYSLKDHADIRRSAVRTWVEHLSSLEVVKTTEVHVLIGLWHTVELVRGEGWASRRPYAMPLARMATSDPVVCRESLEAVVNFHFANGELKTEYEFRQQLLEFEQKTLGPAHPRVLNTLTRLADCAIGTGEADIAQEWYRKAESTSFNVAFHMQDGFYKDDQEVIESLKSLAWSMMQFEEWSRAERILRRALDLQETTLAQDSVKLANTLYYLGRCVREAGNADGQAEDILLRAMSILQKKRRPDHWLTILTQEQLELCERDAEGP